ncbi:MAG: dipeptidyl-peptidase IV [Clostridiales bacterium]|nr:dipeptidyl-peptidase IV [Clostridiales bacterium]
MKKITRIIIWALLSIMMQVAVLVYLDKVLFVDASNFKIVSNETVDKNRDVDYDIPNSAENIKISDDARFISYYENEKLMILDTKSMTTREILTDKGRKILFSDWILDENILMIAEKVPGNNGYNQKVKILTYNVRNDFESEIKILCDYEEGIKVDNIVSSIKTNTHYVGISRTGYNSKIYRIDINNDVKVIANKVPSLGEMKAVQRYDVLIYEDSLNKQFYSYTNGKVNKLKLDNAANLTMIGIDNDKKIYMGELSNEKIIKIIYGQYDSDESTWSSFTLEKPKDLSDIYLSSNDDILVNDNLTGTVKNMTTNETIQYEGKLLQITDKFICSINNNKLIIKSLKNNK